MGKIIFDMPSKELEDAMKEKIMWSDELIQFRDMVSEINISRLEGDKDELQEEFGTIVTHIYKAIIDERETK